LIRGGIDAVKDFGPMKRFVSAFSGEMAIPPEVGSFIASKSPAVHRHLFSERRNSNKNGRRI
jgi:hypothetical protein